MILVSVDGFFFALEFGVALSMHDLRLYRYVQFQSSRYRGFFALSSSSGQRRSCAFKRVRRMDHGLERGRLMNDFQWAINGAKRLGTEQNSGLGPHSCLATKFP